MLEKLIDDYYSAEVDGWKASGKNNLSEYLLGRGKLDFIDDEDIYCPYYLSGKYQLGDALRDTYSHSYDSAMTKKIEKKLANAVTTYTEEDYTLVGYITILVDTTIMGSAKSGILLGGFGTHELYSSNKIEGQKRLSLSYAKKLFTFGGDYIKYGTDEVCQISSNHCGYGLRNFLNLLILENGKHVPSIEKNKRSYKQFAKQIIENKYDLNKETHECAVNEYMFGKKCSISRAAVEGHCEIIEFWLNLGLSVEAKVIDNRGKGMACRTILDIAAQYSHKKIIKLLINKGIDSNAHLKSISSGLFDGAENIFDAIRKGNPEAVEFYLDNGFNINSSIQRDKSPSPTSLLLLAAEADQKKIIEFLLSRGAKMKSDAEKNAILQYIFGEPYNLISAAKSGQLSAVEFILSHGMDSVNMVNEDNWTALHFASRQGHIKITELLLKNKANIHEKNKYDTTALYLASFNGHTEVVKVLLENGADIDVQSSDSGTSLCAASVKGHTEVVKILLENGADVNAKTKKAWSSLMLAAQKGHIEIVNILLQNGADVNAKSTDGDFPLIAATKNGHVELIKILLQNGADVNAKNSNGYSSLAIASQNGEVKEVKILLQNGADVNAKNKYGTSSLIIAAKQGHIKIVNTLLQNGADVNAKNEDGTSSLIIAAKKEHIEIVKTLLQNGADVNAKENYGRSSLDAVLPYGDIEIVKILLQNGADVNAKNSNGLKASIIASINNNKDILELLLKYEEKPLLRKTSHEIVLNKDGETYRLSLKEKQAFEPELPKKHSLGIDLTYELSNANNFDWKSKKEEVCAILGVEHIKLFKDSDNNYVVRVFEDSNEAKLVNLLEIDNQSVELFDFKEENHTTYLYFHTKHGVPLSAWKEKQTFMENILKQPVEIELYDESHPLYDPSYHRENLVLIKEHPISVMPDELKLGGTYLKEEEVNKRKSYTFKDVDSREKWEEKLEDIEKFLGVHLVIKDYNEASKILSLEESLVESLPKILDIKDAHGVYSKLMHTKIEDGRSIYYYSYLHGITIKDWKDQLRHYSLRTIFNKADKVYTIDIYDNSSEDYDPNFSQEQLVKVSEFLEIPSKNDLLDINPNTYLQKDKIFWGYGSGKQSYYTSLTNTFHSMLIGGTDSGKSNFMNGLILSMLYNIESIGKLYLIDLKDGTEFDMYNKLDSKKVEVFANTTKPSLLLAALHEVEAEMYLRTKYVRSKEDIKKVTHDPIFLIIDEYGEIERMRTNTPEERMAKEDIFVVLDRIASQARSSNIKLFLQTQNPRSISREIKMNLKSRALLKTGSASDRELTIQQTDDLDAMDINHVKFPKGRYVFEDINDGDAILNELQFPLIDPGAKYHMDYKDEAQQCKNDFELELQAFVDQVKYDYPHLSDTKILGGEEEESPNDATQAAIAVDEPRQELKKEPSHEKSTEIRLDLDDDLFGFEDEDEDEEDDIFSEITLLEEENKKLFDEIMQGAD